jgi:hypothetical protein
MLKEDPSTQTARLCVDVIVESNGRVSGLSVNSDERTIKLLKISENGQSESKLGVSSESTALNLQNRNTKDTPKETTIKTNNLYPANAVLPHNIYHQNG